MMTSTSIISPKFLRRALEFKEVMAACKRCSRSARSLVRTWRSWWSHREFSLFCDVTRWDHIWDYGWFMDDLWNSMRLYHTILSHSSAPIRWSQMIADVMSLNTFDSDGNIGWNISFDRDAIEMHLCTSCMAMVIAASLGILPSATIFPMAMVIYPRMIRHVLASKTWHVVHNNDMNGTWPIFPNQIKHLMVRLYLLIL